MQWYAETQRGLYDEETRNHWQVTLEGKAVEDRKVAGEGSMAPRKRDTRQKTAVPLNTLLTEDVNSGLGRIALRTSKNAERVSKSDVVRAMLQTGLPLFDLVYQYIPDVPIAQVPELLTRLLARQPVIEAIEKLARERTSVGRARGVVRTRGVIRARGNDQDIEQTFTTPLNPTPGIQLVAPVNTGVYQPPTFSWKLEVEIIKPHLRVNTKAPIRCRVSVSEDDQEVWEELVEIALPRDTNPEQEAQIVRSVALPSDIFEEISSLAWMRWNVQVSYLSSEGICNREASALFLKVTPSQATRAEVEGLLGQGRAYETQGLLEESTSFFREALETSCQQLVALCRMRGLAKADEYQKLLEDIKNLHQLES